MWFGAEGLGNVVGLFKGIKDAAPAKPTTPPARLDRAAALAAIKADYDQNYFISGQGDLAAYAPDCRFADPFASFKGTARFKRNVSNLGGLLSDVRLELTDWEERDGEVRVAWRFSGVLGVPWRPRLAASGSTRHVFDPATGLVVDHVEAWNVSPGEVVRSLVRPAARVPGNRAEAFMASVDAGDTGAAWHTASPVVAVVVGGVAAANAALRLLVGGGAPAGVEAAAWAVAAAAAVTQALPPPRRQR